MKEDEITVSKNWLRMLKEKRTMMSRLANKKKK